MEGNRRVWVGGHREEREMELEMEETLFRGGLVVRARAVGVPPRRAYRDTERGLREAANEYPVTSVSLFAECYDSSCSIPSLHLF